MNSAWAQSWRGHVAALLLYAGLAYGFIAHGESITRTLYAVGNDPFIFVWCLAWWPWAISHHLDAFYTNIIWQPQGVNLAWITSVPALALLALPFTLLAGPVLALNILALASPALAAWAAYFVCLYVCRMWRAAILGGAVFGFSSYEIAHAGVHLNLDFTAFIPLLLLLVLARLDDAIPRRQAVLGGALLIVGEFGTSLELLATEMMFGGFAWALAYWQFPARREVLQRLVVDGAYTAIVAVCVLAPMLWQMFALPRDIHLPPHWPRIFATDPLNLVIPTELTAIGGRAAFSISQFFLGFLVEQGAYMGLPLLAILWVFCRRRNPFFGLLFCGIVLLSFGPGLWLGGTDTHIPLPWAILAKLPLLGQALPGRFMVFAWLLAAIILALWIAEAGPERLKFRLLAGILACLWIAPLPHAVQKIPYSRFFAPGEVQAALGSNPRVLILPFGIMGPSSFWQAENHFGFLQTGGYLGFPPAFIQNDTPMMRFYFGLDTPGFDADFSRFCEITHTQFVVAGQGASAQDLALMRALGWPSRQIEDATVFTVPHG